MAGTDPIVTAVQALDLPSLRTALDEGRRTITARAVVEAARLAWKPGLAVLVEFGADLNGSYRNYRPLHALMQERPLEGGYSTPERHVCLEWLLANGADPELVGGWPLARALVVAAFVGEPLYVDALVEGGARLTWSALAALGNADRLRDDLADSPSLARDRDDGGLTALHCCAGSRLGSTDPAMSRRLLEVARLLIDVGADVRATARSWGDDVDVAYFAINSRQLDLLALLLDCGADPTTSLPPAAWNADEEMLDLLIGRGARIDKAYVHDRPIVNELVRWGQFKQARLLLDRGADPNTVDAEGWTALHQAAQRGNASMVADLITAGANLAQRDNQGRTAADVAIAKGRTRLLSLLG